MHDRDYSAELASSNTISNVTIPPPVPAFPPVIVKPSGPRAHELESLATQGPAGALHVRVLGDEIGAASGLKMAYAALTKGTMTLHTAVLLLARRMGLAAELQRELEESQAAAWQRMAVIPFLPADAGRWIGEMREIAASFRDVGVTSGFHEGAEAMFQLLAATPFASETRETLDRTRSVDDTIAALAELLDRDE